MLNQALIFVVDTIFHLFILAALLRFWMQALKAPVRNPIAQFSMALTDWAVKPLRRVIPGFFKLDLASIVVAWLGEYALQIIVLLLNDAPLSANPGVLPIVFFLAFVKLIRLSVYIIIGAVLIQALLSWVNPYHPIAPFFNALTEPFLKPFRRAVPLIGGVDVTPVLVLIVLQLILMLLVTWLELQAARLIMQSFA